MQLEDFFDFMSPDDIRIKGHRVGIEHVLYEYIFRERSPEEIAQDFDTITLEQIYATILYYLHHKESVRKYIADWLEHGRLMREEQRREHPDLVARMGRLREEREAKSQVGA